MSAKVTMPSIHVLLIGHNNTLLNLMALFWQQADDINVISIFQNDSQDTKQIAQSQPHIVVIDLGTPGLIGLQTITMLHQLMPQTPLIVLSQLRMNGYRDIALAAGADEFICRTNLATELIPAIRRTANGRSS